MRTVATCTFGDHSAFLRMSQSLRGDGAQASVAQALGILLCMRTVC